MSDGDIGEGATVGEPLNDSGRGCAHAGKYKSTPWKIPQYVVPDLTGCEVRHARSLSVRRGPAAFSQPHTVSCGGGSCHATSPHLVTAG